MAWNQNRAFVPVRGSWKMSQVSVASKWVQKRHAIKNPWHIKTILYMTIILFTRQNTLEFWQPLLCLSHHHMFTSLVDFRLHYVSVLYLMRHRYRIQKPQSAAIIESQGLEDPLQVHTYRATFVWYKNTELSLHCSTNFPFHKGVSVVRGQNPKWNQLNLEK
jgi:hypothetical protein